MLHKGQLCPPALRRSLHHARHRKSLEDRLQRLAQVDPLTGLTNRRELERRVRQSLARAQRHHQSCGLLYVDLDRFKVINDTHGHHVGDVVLTTVAERLITSVREYDTVGRLGGDEFAVLLDGIADEQEAIMIAERVLRSVQEPVLVDDESLQVSTSIGVAIAPAQGRTVTELLRAADAGMYRAKNAGRNSLDPLCLTPSPLQLGQVGSTA